MLKVGDRVKVCYKDPILVKYGNVQFFGKVHKIRHKPVDVNITTKLVDVNITTTTKKTYVWSCFPWEVYKLITICS